MRLTSCDWRGYGGHRISGSTWLNGVVTSHPAVEVTLAIGETMSGTPGCLDEPLTYENEALTTESPCVIVAD